MSNEPLLGAQTVDRQLQRATTLRRPAQLVVDQPERAVLKEVEAIGLAAQRDRPRTLSRREREIAGQFVFEQPLDNGKRSLGLHAKDGFAESGRRRRSQQTRPFEPRFRHRQTLERPIDDGGEHVARGVKILWRHRAMPGTLPGGEELLEHVVDEMPLTPRIHHFLILRLLVNLQDVLREKLKGAIEIRLDGADRPGARRDVAHDAVEIRGVSGRPRRAHLRPGSGVTLKRIDGDRIERQRLVREDTGGLEWRADHRREPGARNLVELHRPRHDRILVERERRHERATRCRGQQIQKPRVAGGPSILF